MNGWGVGAEAADSSCFGWGPRRFEGLCFARLCVVGGDSRGLICIFFFKLPIVVEVEDDRAVSWLA